MLDLSSITRLLLLKDQAFASACVFLLTHLIPILDLSLPFEVGERVNSVAYQLSKDVSIVKLQDIKHA